MATVHFSSGLSQHTGGLEQVEIEAPRVCELMAALTERFPPLAGQLEQMAIAIDGVIHHAAAYHTLEVGSQIYFLPRMNGG
jgi:molybdopterin converting factor small subunit